MQLNKDVTKFNLVISYLEYLHKSLMINLFVLLLAPISKRFLLANFMMIACFSGLIELIECIFLLIMCISSLKFNLLTYILKIITDIYLIVLESKLLNLFLGPESGFFDFYCFTTTI